jgi:CheY-like chemotaxis protein
MNKILFIDDDLRTSDHISEILNDKGYDCLFITNPDEAIKAVTIHRNDIALIVLDLMMNAAGMPDEAEIDCGMKTGLVLYQNHLKTVLPDTPVIVMTAIGSLSVLNETKKEKMVFEILQKPVAIFDLEKCIEKAIKRIN